MICNEYEDKKLLQQYFLLLKELELKPSLRGFDYTLSAVLLRRKNPNMPMQKVYSELAKQNNTSWTAVERAIRFTKENLIKHKSKTENFKKVFGNISEMTNFDFVAYLSNHLKYES